MTRRIEVCYPCYHGVSWNEPCAICFSGKPTGSWCRGITPGEVIIGNRCHISIGCVIQGHGGVSIGDAATAGTGTLIYSLSNALVSTKFGPIIAAGSPMDRISTPVAIESNVWIGVYCVILGSTIGADSFIKPFSVVTADIKPNAVASGNPAMFERMRYIAAENDVCRAP